MANIKSAIKRAKIAVERTARNKSVKQAARTSVKRFEAALAGDPAAAKESLSAATSALDKAVTKGVIKRNAASRKKSRLAKKLNAKSSQ